MKQDVDQLLQERGKTHGDYQLFAQFAQDFKEYQREAQVERLSWELQEALDMIIHKIARIVTGNPNYNDHWDDIAGYATLASKSIKAKDNGSTAGKGTSPEPPKEQVCGKSEASKVPTANYTIEKSYTLPPEQSDRYFLYWDR